MARDSGRAPAASGFAVIPGKPQRQATRGTHHVKPGAINTWLPSFSGNSKALAEPLKI